MRAIRTVILASFVVVNAQDVFNATSAGDCESAKAGIREQYSATLRQIDREHRELADRMNQQGASCGTGDSAKPCRTNLAREYDRQNEMLNARAAAAGTERDNALNEVEGTVCVRPLRGGVDRISGTNGVNGGGTRTGNPTTPRRPNVPLPSDGSKGIIYEKDPRP